MNGDPCPGENNLRQVGFTDKRYRCVCRDGYKHGGSATDECEGKVTINNSLFVKSVFLSKNCVFVFVYCRQSSKQCHGSHGIPGESKMSDVEVIEGPGWWSGLVQRAWSVEFRCAIFQILIPFLLAEFNGSQG